MFSNLHPETVTCASLLFHSQPGSHDSNGTSSGWAKSTHVRVMSGSIFLQLPKREMRTHHVWIAPGFPSPKAHEASREFDGILNQAHPIKIYECVMFCSRTATNKDDVELLPTFTNKDNLRLCLSVSDLATFGCTHLSLALLFSYVLRDPKFGKTIDVSGVRQRSQILHPRRLCVRLSSFCGTRAPKNKVKLPFHH